VTGAKFNEPNLDEAEDILGIFYGGDPAWGGKVLVTSRRLLFAPIDLGLLETIARYIADKASIPGADLAGTIIDQVKAYVAREIWLRHIVSVEPNGNGGWFKAPGVRIRTASGETLEFGIVKTSISSNKDPENLVARDRLITLLRAAVVPLA
jgi:hypothetical protein